MEQIVNTQHNFFDRGDSRNISFRKEQLRKLKSLLQNHEDSFLQTLHADFKKPPFETYGTELLVIYREINHILSNLSAWAKPQKVSGSIINFPSVNYIHPQPYGVTLVIGAWNYPIQLALNPALASIAAGNSTIIKPSEITPNTSKLLAELINNSFDPGFLKVVEGDAETTQSLLDQPLDYIFFTGSPRVGKIIMKASADQLTPLTLELGGKSPAIVDQTADLALAAKRIAWGKFINAGQTCVSPDYVYIHQSDQEQFCELIKQSIYSFYGENPLQNQDYASIINSKHFNRLVDLLDTEKVYFGGHTVAEELYIEPTILTGIDWNHKIMQEEIFGPILPILTFQNIDEVIRSVKDHYKPLSLYLFTTKKDQQQKVIDEIQFGGGCINDTVAHLGNLDLPFGGIGHSGFGSYHGKAGFEEFSHQKSILKKATWLDLPLRYPPYEGNLKWLKKLNELL